MIRVGLRTCLWEREETAGLLLRHYDAMVPQLGEHGIELITVAVHSQDRAYISRVSDGTSRWEFLFHENMPLREKLRSGLGMLRGRDVLFALNIGGDDFIGLPTFLRLVREFQDGADMTAWKTAYVAHARYGVDFWPGYPGARADEPFGPGRGLSPRMLDILDWDPWKDAPHQNMDGTYWKRVKALAPDMDRRLFRCEEIGPIVDVKDAGSLTKWGRTASYNRHLGREEAQVVLEQVGLGDLLRR